MGHIEFGVMLPVMIPSGQKPRSLYHALQYNYGNIDVNLLKEVALETERLGYHSVWVSDHLSKYSVRERLECWTTMTWLATLTKRIRIGSMVLCNLYRHPALLAKMASTLDIISDGRLEFGIGAGWNNAECIARGIVWPDNPVRLRMMRETVEICKSLWTQETTNYEGKHYILKGTYSEPKPIQKPYPPVMIGGSGERTTLRIVAKHANKSNFGGPPELLRRRIDILKRHCKDVGRDFDSIEKTSNITVVIHGTTEKYLADMRRRWAADGSPGSYEAWLEKAEELYIAGTPEDCANQIQAYTDLGVRLLVIRFGDIPNLDGLKLFAKEVIPRIRT